MNQYTLLPYSQRPEGEFGGNGMISERTIGRISLYRRMLVDLEEQGVQQVFSHELAAKAWVTASQARRDIMSMGCSGSPVHGYGVKELIGGIRAFLDAPEPEAVVLVGVGNLGRAILSYFSGRRPNLMIVAAFDSDPQKVSRTISGCPCYGTDELPRFAAQHGIRMGIVTVPASAAQAMADLLVRSGIHGILNFAPAMLRAPAHVYIAHVDMTMSLEKVAYFARQASQREALR